MNKAVLSTLIVTIALLTEGCSLFSSADSEREQETETVQSISVQANGQQETETETEEFADLEEETEPVSEVAGLIPATDPNVRVRNSVRGRQDPFSVVSLNPRIEIEETESNNQPNSNNIPNRTQNPSPSASANSDSNLPVPDPPPNPALAEDVVITGLYQANGTTKLIVKAPEESNSRYVEVGEYLSNGRVLVKSIDMSQSPPLVILEQAGVEVAKVIGGDSEEEENLSFLPQESFEDRSYRLSGIF